MTISQVIETLATALRTIMLFSLLGFRVERIDLCCERPTLIYAPFSRFSRTCQMRTNWTGTFLQFKTGNHTAASCRYCALSLTMAKYHKGHLVRGPYI
jgi:hypothetical protein